MTKRANPPKPYTIKDYGRSIDLPAEYSEALLPGLYAHMRAAGFDHGVLGTVEGVRFIESASNPTQIKPPPPPSAPWFDVEWVNRALRNAAEEREAKFSRDAADALEAAMDGRLNFGVPLRWSIDAPPTERWSLANGSEIRFGGTE